MDTNMSSTSNSKNQKKPAQIRPDFNTDVLWKPPRTATTRQRTISTDSADSDLGPVTPTERRFSLSGFLMGASAGIGGLVRQSSVEQNQPPIKKTSLTEQVDFKEFMRHQNRVLSDDEGFRIKDYVRKQQMFDENMPKMQ